MITGPAIQHAEIARLVGCLCIEISTGMRASRGSAMEQARKWCGSPKRTKAGMLEDLLVWFYGNGGLITAQWATVNRALGEPRAQKLQRRCLRAGKTYEARKAEEIAEITKLLGEGNVDSG